jgi:hypothetical protein
MGLDLPDRITEEDRPPTRFCTKDAPTARKIFAHRRKTTFANTIRRKRPKRCIAAE